MRVSRSLVTFALVILVALLSGSASARQPCTGPHTCVDLGGMSCEEKLAEFLRTAEVISIEDIGDGITKPRRVTLKKGDHSCRAIFKTVDISTTDVAYTNRLESVFTDKYVYEVAAYRIDRMLGIGLVPVTVLREIDGELGSLQYWVEGCMKMQDAADRDLQIKNMDLLLQRLMLMYVLDAMIYNIDRNYTNVLVRPDADDFFLIDHSRAFRTKKKLPALKEERPIAVPAAVADGLTTLDLATLESELDGLLSKRQIRAIESRRKLLVAELDALGVLPRTG